MFCALETQEALGSVAERCEGYRYYLIYIWDDIKMDSVTVDLKKLDVDCIHLAVLYCVLVNTLLCEVV